MNASLRNRAEGGVAAALALVLIVGALALSTGSGDADLRSSTYVNDRRGLRALFLLLERAGAEPSRAHAPLAAADPTDRTFVIAAPSWPVTRDEAAAALDWAAAGGRIVVIAPAPLEGVSRDASPILAPLGIAALQDKGSASVSVSVLHAEWAADLRGLAWRPRQVLEADEAGRDPRAWPAEELAVTSRDAPVVLRVALGRGEVVVVSDESWLTNLHLRDGDAAVLAVRLLLDRKADRGRVIFDEFHHGWDDTGGRSGLAGRLAGDLVTTWPGRALLALVAAALVYAVGAAVRFGAPLPEPPPPRRALREHADALGRLLEQARASGEALGLLVDGVRRTCAPRIGMAPHASAEELSRRLASSHAEGAAELAAALDEAELSSHVSQSRQVFARVAARLAAARRRFLHG